MLNQTSLQNHKICQLQSPNTILSRFVTGKASVGASASKRTGGGSSPSLSAGSSSPGLVHKSRSREGISSSASSKR